jgi:site-specific recombinases, DNA invertase pin homologs
LDCLKYIRQLKEKNVPVFFEKENINTLDAKGEVLLTIMASLAQQESESLSKNVKMGLQFRYQNGEVQINHNWFLGYTKDENGHLIIDEEQAVVVRRIFREYLQGASLKNIADGLMADGIPTATGNMKWRSDGIRKILMNFLTSDFQIATKYVGVRMQLLEYLGELNVAKEVLQAYQHVVYDFLTKPVTRKGITVVNLMHDYFPYTKDNLNCWHYFSKEMQPALERSMSALSIGMDETQNQEIYVMTVENDDYGQ